MVKLYLTRHGETVENAAKILQGQSQGHLNKIGIQQARQLRDRLAKKHFDSIICSDLQRSIDTAHIVNERQNVPLILCPLLRERDWGEFTGLLYTNITTQPKDFPPSIENSQQLAIRASAFIKYLLDSFDECCILAVGHGFFDRCIVAYLESKSVHDIPRWNNVEIRTFYLNQSVLHNKITTDDTEVSAN